MHKKLGTSLTHLLERAKYIRYTFRLPSHIHPQ